MISHAFKLMGGCALLLAVLVLIIAGLVSKPFFIVGILIFTWSGISALIFVAGKLIHSAVEALNA